MKLLAAAALALLSWSALAQEPYPSKPIRILVGYAAGGGNDIIVRVMLPELQKGLGQPVIVENKPGAQSIVAAELAARAPADGYTLFMGPSGPMTINPATYSKLPYSPLRDFAPISLICEFPLLVTVDARLPVRTVNELIAYAKANPGKLSYGTPGTGTSLHLAMEEIAAKAGVQFLHVPFKGQADSAQALMGGHIMAQVDSTGWARQVDAGTFRLLATLGDRRTRWNAPTVKELGIDTVSNSPYGLVGPKGLPPPVLKRLHDAFKAASDDPENMKTLQQLDQLYWYKSSEDYAKWAAERLQAERATIERVGLLVK